MVCNKLQKVNITAEVFIMSFGSGYFILSAILPQYLLQKSCLATSNATICNDLGSATSKQQHAQEEASFWLTMIYIARLLPACFTLMVWGSIVDRVGQHRAMLFPPFIMGLQALLLILCSLYPSSSYIYIVAISSLSCLYGDFPGGLLLSFSYIASITKAHNRSKRMTVIQGGAMLSDVVAGVISGVVLQELGFQFAFGVVVVICAMTFSFVLFFAKPIVHAPSDTPEKVPAPESFKSYLNPWKSFKRAFVVVYHSEYRKNFLFIMAAIFFNFASARGSKFIIVLYVTNSPFNFSPMLVGYYLAFLAVVRGPGTVIFNQLLTKCLKSSDFVLLYLGLGSLTVVSVLIGLSKSTLMLFLVSLLGSTAYLSPPVLRGFVTKLVDNQNAAKALSVLETVGMVCSLLSSVVVTNVYRMTLAFNTGFIYFLLALFAMIALLIIIVMHYMLRNGMLVDPASKALNDVNTVMLAVDLALEPEQDEGQRSTENHA